VEIPKITFFHYWWDCSWAAGPLYNFISIDADFDSEYNREIFILIAAMVDALDTNY
jgi:hypothetical protein